MLERMPLSVFHDWMAYYQCEPFGEWRRDHRAAIVACTVSNAMRGRKGRRARIKDFMPDFGPKVLKRQSGAEMKANLLAFTAGMKAKQEAQKNRCRQ